MTEEILQRIRAEVPTLSTIYCQSCSNILSSWEVGVTVSIVRVIYMSRELADWFLLGLKWWISSLIGEDRRGGGEPEGDASSQHYLFCVVFCMMCLNKAQQEKLKLCGRNEKYLPRMEKLTGVCSLGDSRVILFLFPFCACIFCWARPSEYTLVWQLDLPKWEPACVLVSMHLLNVEIIFSKSIKDLVKWSSHQQGACWTLPCSVCAL